MRRILRPLFLVFAFATMIMPLTAQSQKLYDADSYEYRSVERLCRLSGSIGPSSATPVSEAELLSALSRVDIRLLDKRHAAEYCSVRDKLFSQDSYFIIDFDLAVAPQIFLSKDYDKIVQDDFFIPFNTQDPLLDVGFSLEFRDFAYLETSFEFMNNSIVLTEDKKGIPLSSFAFLMDYRNSAFRFAMNGNPVLTYGEFPSLARGSFGNEVMNITIGRTRQKMGRGRTGNMVIGDNYRFQEAMDLTLFSVPFTYSLNITHFDNQNTTGEIIHTRYSGKQQLRLIHRLDVSIGKKARAVVNIGNVIYTDNPFDIRYLIPLFMSHNLYNFSDSVETTLNDFDETNNIVGFEIEYCIIPRLEIGFQFAVDQLKTFIETGESLPNAYGGLIDISYMATYGGIDVDYWAELYYSTDTLYLNKKTTNNHTEYNYDWALGYWRRDTIGDLQWSGHPFGPGVFAFSLGSDIEIPSGISIQPTFAFKYSGDRTLMSEYDSPVNERFFSFEAKAIADWRINSNLEAFVGLYSRFRWALSNGVFSFLPQSIIGIRWEI